MFDNLQTKRVIEKVTRVQTPDGSPGGLTTSQKSQWKRWEKSTKEANEIQRSKVQERKKVQKLKKTSVKLSEMVEEEEKFCVGVSWGWCLTALKKKKEKERLAVKIREDKEQIAK